MTHFCGQRTHSSFAGGLNSINIVMSNPAKTAACVPTVTATTVKEKKNVGTRRGPSNRLGCLFMGKGKHKAVKSTRSIRPYSYWNDGG